MERWRRDAIPRRTSQPLRRVRWRPIAAAATAAAVVAIAALVLLIPRCGDDAAPAIQVAFERVGPTPRRGLPTIDDVLRVRVRVDAPYVELRVYRDRVLVARCPGDERCRRDGASLSIGLVIDGPGQYEVIRLSSGEPLPPPQASGLDVDVLTARERGVRVVSEPPITVR